MCGCNCLWQTGKKSGSDRMEGASSLCWPPSTNSYDGRGRCSLPENRDSRDLTRTTLSVGFIAVLIVSSAWIVRPFGYLALVKVPLTLDKSTLLR